MSRRSETTTKVFVGSLPVGVTPDDLRTLFAPYGAIAECDISNRCGFLHLEDQDLAMKAITELNGTNFMGGRISVEKGRVKPRRGPGGPMRGGKDRGGPYSRGGDFRGPPHRNGGGFGVGRDFPPFGAGGGDRFGYDRPQRGGFDGGFGDRRPPFDDRRGAAGFGGDRRPGGFNDFNRRPYGDIRGAAGFGDNPRDGFEDRRLADPQGPPPPRGPGPYDRGAPPVGELFSRRDQGMKPMGANFNEAPFPATGPTNGYTTAGGYSTGNNQVGYATAPSGPMGAYGGAAGAFGGNATPAANFNDNRAGAGGGGGGGFSGNAAGYRSQGGFGDNYGPPAGARGAYDAAYPPLPNQRGGFELTSGS